MSRGSWHRLSNGRYTAVLDEAGSGYSALGEIALTRWCADPIEDRDGFFVYVRDRESGGHWSAGFQPAGRRPERYAVTLGAGSLEIERMDQGIETMLAVRVAPNEDLELRRCTVQNDAPVRRRIEVTSYAEVVLAPRSADAAHPAFSKLFVETEQVPGQRAVVARRRPRSAGEKPLWLVHWLAIEDFEAGAIEHETDRMRFIGRGRNVARPRALTERTPLSGTVGAVLDAIVSLRITLDLPPGAQKTVCFGLGAAPTRETALEWAARYGRLRSIGPLFEPATEASCARSIAHFSLPAAPDRYRPAGDTTPPPGRCLLSEEELPFTASAKSTQSAFVGKNTRRRMGFKAAHG